MPSHIWSVVCYKGSLDSFTNQVSLIDIIENINVRLGNELVAVVASGKTPMLPIKMEVVSFWERSERDTPESFEMRVALLCPDGTQRTPNQAFRPDLRTAPRARTFNRLDRFPYRGPGKYMFQIQCRDGEQDEWVTAGTVPVDVILEKSDKENDEAVEGGKVKPSKAAQ